jgi:hypothetical protein
MNNLGKYFIPNNGDSPDRIFFNIEDAIQSNQAFIDIFDENGIKIQVYEMDGKTNRYVIYNLYPLSNNSLFTPPTH